MRLGIKEEISVSGIMVKPTVLSGRHEFTFGGFSCVVELPKRPKFKEGVSKSDSDVFLFSHRELGNRIIPISCIVTKVILTIDLKKTVPYHLAKRTIGSRDYYNSEFAPKNKQMIEKLSVQTEDLAEKAMHYWISIIRWKCEHPLLRRMRSAEENHITVNNPLIDLNTGENLPMGVSINISVNTVEPITLAMWKLSQQCLSKNEQIPLWMLYFRDAKLRYAKSDYRSAVLFLAVACESILRHFASDILENPQCRQQQKSLEKLQIRYLSDNWEKFSVLKRHRLKIDRAAINTLFEIRNDIMHRGICNERMILQQWRNFYAAVENVVEGGQKLIDKDLR
jgi:hypothetical protein